MANFLDKAKNFVAEKIANIEKPEAPLSDVDLKSVTRECVEYKAEINVTNPYGHLIPICEISFKLQSAGRDIASGTIPGPGSLKPKDTRLLEVQVKCPYSTLVSLAKDIGRDWDIDYQLDVGLTIENGFWPTEVGSRTRAAAELGARWRKAEVLVERSKWVPQ